MLVLQKTLSSILELPGLFIFLIFVITIFFRSRKKLKIALMTLIFCFYLLSTGFFSQWLIAPLEQWFYFSYDETRSINPRESAIVVLSSSHRVGVPTGYDGKVSDELEKTTLIRLHKGYLLYREQPMPIIVTGGVLWSSNEKPVAQTMAQTLLLWGVPEKDIVIEDRAMTTDQNAAYSLALLDPSVTTLFIVTSAVHLPRAMLAFETEAKKRALPLRITPIPTDFFFEKRETIWLDFLPSSGAFTATMSAVHEWLGLLFYKLFK
ncbi:MAG TPA: YdcF family protein [Thermotogota bacterium]|nr:YdcF family protein [Thermotogota bacterium]